MSPPDRLEWCLAYFGYLATLLKLASAFCHVNFVLGHRLDDAADVEVTVLSHKPVKQVE